ncbi:hypothetical protein BDN72DRAFT_899433 [Pluteus cervinus]|uniref:Uncharacterized protein n=1 Tax=Pluteus cervinus TaxID=181527 RepID=A0ACD3AMC5_9AGAR|nr:hypothetical protein BDN72DRAFT_899433 [Pluteus cervinus]
MPRNTAYTKLITSQDGTNQPQLRRIGCRLLAPTLILLTLSGGLATFLILWLTAIHGVDGQTLQTILKGRAFIANEGTKEMYGVTTARLLGLTISSATTNIVSMTAPFLVGLAGYCVAGMWLNGQESGTILLTPIQYGLLVKLLSVSGLASFIDGSRYLFMKPKIQGGAAPNLLTAAFTLAIITYSITHLIGLTDLWLHATSSAIIYNVTTYPQGADLGYGAVLNGSVQGCMSVWAECPLLSNPADVQTAFAVSLNASTSLNISVPWSVNTLHDSQDMAVFVPHTSDPHLLWSAPSFGVRVNCSNITPQCLSQINTSHTYNYSTSPADNWLNSPLPQYSGASSRDGNPIIENAIVPFHSDSRRSFLQFSWPVVNLSAANQFVSFDGNSRASAFAICSVSLFNVTLSHTGDYSFTLRDEDTKPFVDPHTNLVSALQAGIYFTGTNQLANYLLPYAMLETNEANIIAALNQGLSRNYLGTNAYLFQGVAAQNFSSIQPTIVSRYSLVPLFAYISLILIYSLLAVAIFIWASLIPTPVVKAPNGEEITSLELTQRHLTNPMVIVASLLHSPTGPPPDPQIGMNPGKL